MVAYVGLDGSGVWKDDKGGGSSEFGSYTSFYKSPCETHSVESTWVFFGRIWAFEIPGISPSLRNQAITEVVWF